MVSTMTDPISCPPAVRLLSNGHYNVLVTAAGSGYSVVDGMDVTRWREDVTCDPWGQYCYVRDLEEGRVWSAGRQPIGAEADEYEADLRLDRASFAAVTEILRLVTKSQWSMTRTRRSAGSR
jgi:cellobiose phosphorylase